MLIHRQPEQDVDFDFDIEIGEEKPMAVGEKSIVDSTLAVEEQYVGPRNRRNATN